ncbi:hypothetical protein STEG23_016385, partial [Scotinomys teguina]
TECPVLEAHEQVLKPEPPVNEFQNGCPDNLYRRYPTSTVVSFQALPENCVCVLSSIRAISIERMCLHFCWYVSLLVSADVVPATVVAMGILPESGGGHSLELFE